MVLIAHPNKKMRAVEMANETEPQSIRQNAVEDDQLDSDEEITEVDGIRIPASLPPPTDFTHNSTRLLITQIQMEFFKSFTTSKVIGPFHKCFNAVIGPNGSGKSNVIDSLLFVFGYRASKIRMKAVSELIHKSEQHNNVQMCCVQVHFVEIIDEEGDNFRIVENSGIIVARTARKDGSSYYELNGKRVEFRKIGKLLRQHGIDLSHNRFLILQGEIEEIAMMKCKAENPNETGMLEYLEEIIGTKRYEEPIQQLEDRLEVLTTQRTEKFNRVKLVQSEMEQLQKPMEEACEFLKTENEIAVCKNFVFQHKIFELQQQNAPLESDLKNVVGEQEALNEKLAGIEEKKSEQQKILKKETAKYEHTKVRNEKSKAAFHAADKMDVKIQADMTEMVNSRKKRLQDIQNDERKLVEYRKVPEKNAKAISEAEIREQEFVEQLETLNSDKKEIYENIRQETQHLQDEKQALQQEYVSINDLATEKKSRLTLAENQVKMCGESRDRLERTLTELRETSQTTDAKILQYTEQMTQLTRDIPDTERLIRQRHTDHTTAVNELQTVEGQLGEIQSNLEEVRQSRFAHRSHNTIVEALMRQKDDGKCAGLFGRLGDLGGIDQKYDVAISTACRSLDSFVTDTANTAEWCIEYLKSSGQGRASFIALEKIQYLDKQANSKIQTPENVHRLYDLITISDPRLRPAFYFVLRDTLVAQELAQASRIAYGATRYRVVTLKGDIIEISGTMSGGGAPLRGKMGQSASIQRHQSTLASPHQISALERRFNQLQQRSNELRSRQTVLSTELADLQTKLKQYQTTEACIKQENSMLQMQAKTIQIELKKLQTQLASVRVDETKLAQLQKAVKAAQAEYDKVLKEGATLQALINKLSAQIEAKTAGRLGTVEQRIKETGTKMQKCRTEVKRLKVDVKMSEKNVEQTVERLEQWRHEVTTYEIRLKDMQQKRIEIEEDGQKLMKCIEEAVGHLAASEEIMNTLRTTLGDLTRQQNDLKSTKVDVDELVRKTQRRKQEFDANLNQLRGKLAALRIQELPLLGGVGGGGDADKLPELVVYGTDDLTAGTLKRIVMDLDTAERQLKTLKPNLATIEEYMAKKETFIRRTTELDEVSTKRTHIRQVYDGLRSRRKNEFLYGYNIIRLKLKEIYQMITLGGDADFEMIDSFDPFADGIQFMVRPPKKSWKNISNLSGGEKTLSSLALVFALHYYKPSPLYVMDEIDAALDFKNVSIVGHYIKERTKNAQFIIISLRAEMFELCDRLLGIYKTSELFSNSITIDPREFQPVQSTAVTERIDNDKVLPSGDGIGNGEETVEENGGGNDSSEEFTLDEDNNDNEEDVDDDDMVVEASILIEDNDPTSFSMETD